MASEAAGSSNSPGLIELRDECWVSDSCLSSLRHQYGFLKRSFAFPFSLQTACSKPYRNNHDVIQRENGRQRGRENLRLKNTQTMSISTIDGPKKEKVTLFSNITNI
jgi:hypothetical protein